MTDYEQFRDKSDLHAALLKAEGDLLAEQEEHAKTRKERDEARADAVSGTPAFREEYEAVSTALAAWQAHCARLREAARALRTATANLAFEARDRDEFEAAARACDAALASAPGSMDALRGVVREAVSLAYERGSKDSYDDYPGTTEGCVNELVARILKERSDDAPQGRGDRGEEGGE